MICGPTILKSFSLFNFSSVANRAFQIWYVIHTLLRPPNADALCCASALTSTRLEVSVWQTMQQTLSALIRLAISRFCTVWTQSFRCLKSKPSLIHCSKFINTGWFLPLTWTSIDDSPTVSSFLCIWPMNCVTILMNWRSSSQDEVCHMALRLLASLDAVRQCERKRLVSGLFISLIARIHWQLSRHTYLRALRSR